MLFPMQPRQIQSDANAKMLTKTAQHPNKYRHIGALARKPHANMTYCAKKM